jgi:hypothetical protein
MVSCTSRRTTHDHTSTRMFILSHEHCPYVTELVVLNVTELVVLNVCNFGKYYFKTHTKHIRD